MRLYLLTKCLRWASDLWMISVDMEIASDSNGASELEESLKETTPRVRGSGAIEFLSEPDSCPELESSDDTWSSTTCWGPLRTPISTTNTTLQYHPIPSNTIESDALRWIPMILYDSWMIFYNCWNHLKHFVVIFDYFFIDVERSQDPTCSQDSKNFTKDGQGPGWAPRTSKDQDFHGLPRTSTDSQSLPQRIKACTAGTKQTDTRGQSGNIHPLPYHPIQHHSLIPLILDNAKRKNPSTDQI